VVDDPSVSSPEFFLDRSLGRHQVPAMLRANELRLHTLSEVYGVPADESVADVTWLEHAGREGWVVLMKDARIRYREAERLVLIEHRVRAFCLTGGNLRAAEMGSLFLNSMDQILAASVRPGPLLYTLSKQGIRAVSLD
jgi:PIN like domain